MCPLCGQSPSSAHTQAEAQMCMYSHAKMNGHLHVYQPQVFAHEQKHAHGHAHYHHKAIFQRIVDEKCLSSPPFLANLRGEWRAIDYRARQLAVINKCPC